MQSSTSITFSLARCLNIFIGLVVSLSLMPAASAQGLGFRFVAAVGQEGMELTVIKVTPGETGHQMGLRHNDTIVRVNGMAFPIQQSYSAIERTLQKMLEANGGEVVLHVRRNGQLGTLQGRLKRRGSPGSGNATIINNHIELSVPVQSHESHGWQRPPSPYWQQQPQFPSWQSHPMQQPHPMWRSW